VVTEPSAEELTAAYRAFRLRLTDMGRGLDQAVADAKTPTCPDWSVKDVLAHMTGIAADILDGNVEGAATEAWADAQVDKRRYLSLAEVLDEWDTKGPLLEDVLMKVARAIPGDVLWLTCRPRRSTKRVDRDGCLRVSPSGDGPPERRSDRRRLGQPAGWTVDRCLRVLVGERPRHHRPRGTLTRWIASNSPNASRPLPSCLARSRFGQAPLPTPISTSTCSSQTPSCSKPSVLSSNDLRAEGALVSQAVCVIDREAGGAANLAEADVELRSVFTRSYIER